MSTREHKSLHEDKLARTLIVVFLAFVCSVAVALLWLMFFGPENYHVISLVVVALADLYGIIAAAYIYILLRDFGKLLAIAMVIAILLLVVVLTAHTVYTFGTMMELERLEHQLKQLLNIR